MSRVETLEILGDLIDDLDALPRSEPGSPLRSADWNVLLGAMTSLAKLVSAREESLGEQLEEGFAAAKHDHRGEANLGWFEPDTRALLEAATGGSAEQRLGQQKTARALDEIRADMQDLRKEFEALRLSLDQLRDADFARERAIGRVANDVESLRGLEDGVSNLSARLGGIDGDIADVIAFRDSLGGDGDTVDVRGLANRVGELEGLRENLLTADGEVVRIREIESWLTRLDQDITPRDEIDALVVARVNDAGVFEDAGFLDDLSARVSTGLDPRIAAVEAGIEGVRGDLDGVTESLGPIDDRLGALDAGLAGQGARLDGLETLPARLDRAEARLGQAETGIETNTAGIAQIDRLSADLSALGVRVDGFATTTTLAQRNAAELRNVAARTSTLETTTAGLDVLGQRVTRIEGQVGMIDGLDARIGTLEQTTTTLDRRLDLAEAELGTLELTTERLTVLERQTSGFAEWQRSTDRRIEQLSVGGDTRLAERVSVLEEGMADNRVRLTSLSRTLNLSGGGIVTPLEPIR